MIRACLPTLLLFAIATLALPRPAQAQINRCTAPDGTSIYTDRDCSQMGAVERLPRDRTAAASQNRYRGCARSIHQLIREMTAAIDAGDVNRLAGVYHWPGTSTRGGHGLMDRLDRIVRNPVVDIVAIRAARPVVAAQQPGISATFASTLQVRNAAPAPAVRAPPVALRVHQLAGDSSVPLRTTFTLRQHLDCWWVSL
ncbi:DUF4124 domain-containing protein [Luteimonas sp. A478]